MKKIMKMNLNYSDHLTIILTSLLIFSLPLNGICKTRIKQKHPNIVMITCHDLGSHLGCSGVETVQAQVPYQGIVYPNSPSYQELLAAKEVRRYIYMRTGSLLSITQGETIPEGSSDYIVVGRSDQALIREVLLSTNRLSSLDSLQKQEYMLISVQNEGRNLAVITRLTKLKMNFMCIHAYPEFWQADNMKSTLLMGFPEDVNSGGSVKSAYSSSLYNSHLPQKWGLKGPKNTSDYHFGAAMMFERDDWGSELMVDLTPVPDTPEENIEMYNRTGVFMEKAFTYAKKMGFRTALGTTSPLVVPQGVQEHMNTLGYTYTYDTDIHLYHGHTFYSGDLELITKLYEGIFKRIMNTHPLDYYWFWTDEGWRSDITGGFLIAETVNDMKIALETADKMKVPFKFATAGWAIGPSENPTLFDQATMSMEYSGEPRVFAPTVRTSLEPGEVLSLKVIILDNGTPANAELYWRPMGTGAFQQKALSHVTRGVYRAEFPAATEDMEYYVKVTSNDGEDLYFPATAPEINQTIVVCTLNEKYNLKK